VLRPGVAGRRTPGAVARFEDRPKGKEIPGGQFTVAAAAARRCRVVGYTEALEKHAGTAVARRLGGQYFLMENAVVSSFQPGVYCDCHKLHLEQSSVMLGDALSLLSLYLELQGADHPKGPQEASKCNSFVSTAKSPFWDFMLVLHTCTSPRYLTLCALLDDASA
jgi:hypothetical protein